MDSNIMDLESLFEYLKKNEKSIYKKIFQTYGLPTSKIKNLPEKENELLVLSTGINMSIEEKLSKLIKKFDDDNSKIYDEVKDDFDFNSRIGFFEVLSKKVGGNVHVVDLKSSVFKTLVTDKNSKLQKGDLLFGFSFFDSELGDSILYNNYIILTDDERQIVGGIYDEYFVDDDTDVFFDNVVLPRLMKDQVQQIDELLSKHTLGLMKNYNQASIYNFFKHFSDTIKYSLFKNEEVNVYNLDYFDFLMKETKAGNFVVEYDLEIFIDILDYVMSNEVMLNPSRQKVMDSIYDVKSKLLILKNNLSTNYPQTSIELADMIGDSDFLEGNETSGILILGLYIYEIANLEEPKVTKKTRRLAAKTVRELLSDTSTIGINPKNHGEEVFKEIMQLAVSIMLSNGLAGVKEDDSIYLTNRFSYFIMAPPHEVIANLLTALFRKETLQWHISRKNENYDEILQKMCDFIISLDATGLKSTVGGRKILEDLEIIGLVVSEIVNGEEYFQRTVIGEIYGDFLKSKLQYGKVLNIEDYK